MKSFFPVLILVLLVAALAVPLKAQPVVNPINLGVRAGLALGQASFTPDLSGASKSFRTGITGGLYADFGVSPSFFVDAELLYAQGGVKVSSGGFESTVKVDDIAIPISAKYKFPMEGSNVKPYVFAGPDVGFVMKGEVESGGATQDIKDSLETIGFGLHAGAGIEIEVSPGFNLLLDARYDLGLKNVSKISGLEIKPWDIGVLLGASWRIN